MVHYEEAQLLDVILHFRFATFRVNLQLMEVSIKFASQMAFSLYLIIAGHHSLLLLFLLLMQDLTLFH
jgi:hypothetical protein